MATKMKSFSLWSHNSMISLQFSLCNLRHDVEISKSFKLCALLKKQNEGFSSERIFRSWSRRWKALAYGFIIRWSVYCLISDMTWIFQKDFVLSWTSKKKVFLRNKHSFLVIYLFCRISYKNWINLCSKKLAMYKLWEEKEKPKNKLFCF